MIELNPSIIVLMTYFFRFGMLLMYMIGMGRLIRVSMRNENKYMTLSLLGSTILNLIPLMKRRKVPQTTLPIATKFLVILLSCSSPGIFGFFTAKMIKERRKIDRNIAKIKFGPIRLQRKTI